MELKKPPFLDRNYSFIIIPKDLYYNPRYHTLSTEAKMMYGFFIDRTSLSYVNGPSWVNENGDFFIFYRQKEICERLHCGHDKASKIMKELESAELISRDYPQKGGAARIVVLPFEPASPSDRKQSSKAPKSRTIPSGKTDANKTEENKPECNNTDYNKHEISDQIRANISYEILKDTIPVSILNLIVSVMTDAVCSDKQAEKIGSRTWDRNDLRKYLLSLNDMNIRYVYDLFQNTAEEIHNPRRYFLSLLCEADDGAMEAYYESRVRHDFSTNTL